MNPEDQIRVTELTAHRDYILRDYVPYASPAGRLQPQSWLRHLLRRQGWLEAVWPVCDRLIAHLGPDQTVWGVKWGPKGFGLELYVYNNTQNQPPGPASVTPCLQALSPLRIDSKLDESSPYFMWSLELTSEGLAAGRGEDVRIYLGSGEKGRTPGGFSFRMQGTESLLENHYAFYDPRSELEDVYARLAHSPRCGGKRDWALLIPAFLRECFTICYAVKPRYDGLYFARLHTSQLQKWLERHQLPLADELAPHAEDFAHVAWDLGFDFRLLDGRAHIDKFAIHGIF